MKQCPLCQSEDIQKARNGDAGFFKADKIKPIRMWQYRCNCCGFVATMAPPKEEAT